MKETVYLIIGYPANGKTEVSKAIAKVLSLPRGSTSDIVYETLAASKALYNSTSTKVELARLREIPKSELRDDLVKCGDHLRAAAGLDYIVWSLVKRGCRVIDGARRSEELASVRARLAKEGFDSQVWWVERIPPPARIHDNTTVTEADADFIFKNDFQTTDALCEHIKSLLQP